jgi:adenylate cyclase
MREVSLPDGINSADGPVMQRIIELHRWAIGAGLRGGTAAELFEELCRRLVAAGVPLWRAFAGMRTLHPQWAGYTYTWWRHRDAVEPGQLERGDAYEQELQNSPFAHLLELAMRNAGGGEGQPLRLRRRLTGPAAQLDFPILEGLAAAGATDYLGEVIGFGEGGDPSRGTGIGYSFTADRPSGFDDDDIRLICAVLPAVSLAIMSHAQHTIAAGLLRTYLGNDAGDRVHAGAVARGSLESIRAVLWYADMRGFTAIADMTPGPVLVELLDETFEILTAGLRMHGGQVLKFLGDGMLATFPLGEREPQDTCRRALDAAIAAMRGVERLGALRRHAGKPVAAVDLALHLGEVLYGNVGAVDRLDFTVIGPAVNEVARIETLCEPLGRSVLVSASFAAALADPTRLEPLGAHPLRGVREPRGLYALRPR